MNRKIDILIGDFNLLSHLEIFKRMPNTYSSFILSVEYDKTIKTERARERVKQLIDDWGKATKDISFFLKKNKEAKLLNILSNHLGMNLDNIYYEAVKSGYLPYEKFLGKNFFS